MSCAAVTAKNAAETRKAYATASLWCSASMRLLKEKSSSTKGMARSASQTVKAVRARFESGLFPCMVSMKSTKRRMRQCTLLPRYSGGTISAASLRTSDAATPKSPVSARKVSWRYSSTA